MHKKSIIKFFISLFLLIFHIPLYSETFQITHEIYDINGITKEKFISHTLPINHKTIYESKEELEKYISEIKQKYQNMRLFDDVTIECMYSPSKEDSTTPVFLEIKIIDSKNTILVPYYKYNEKYGHVITVVYRDSNFLGTLETLQTELFFEMKESGVSKGLNFTLGTAFKYNVPFYLGKIAASFVNDYMVKYTFGNSVPEYDANTGFIFTFPFKEIYPQLKLIQSAVHNLDYKIFNDQQYFTEFADFSIPIKVTSNEITGDVVYTPSVNFTYNWKPNSKISIRDDDLLSPELLFSNTISFQNVNWYGNMRKGISFNLKQNTGYNFLINQPVVGAETEFTGHFSNEYAGFFLRMYGFVYKNKNKIIDYKLRGIKNSKLFNEFTDFSDTNSTSSSCALMFNFDFPIKIWTTDFEKMHMPVFKSLNFELQVVPFIDIALNKNRVTGRIFDLRDGFYTAGIEFIAFPLKWKSLCVTAIAGVDLGRLLFKNIIDTSWRPDISPYEISVGLGLFY